MPYTCDGNSVGVLIFDDHDRLLMITRAKAPSGIAPVAGHVKDENPEYTHVDAAVAETREEVGLTVRPEDLRRVYTQWHPNRCGATIPADPVGHDWEVYWAKEWSGTITRAEDEAADVAWYTMEQVQELADRTMAYARGEVTEEEWQESPGLEPIWVDILLVLHHPRREPTRIWETIVQVRPGVMQSVRELYAGPAPVVDVKPTNVVQYTNSGETQYLDGRAGDFTYLDPSGRTIRLDCEELTVTEDACTHEVSATVGLPDPGTDAALLLMRALMQAMELHEDYELVKKQQPAHT